MTDKSKPEISPQKRSLKLAPFLGDWTTYRPLRMPTKKVKVGLYGFDRLSEEELKQAHLIHYNFALKLCESLKTKLRIGVDFYSIDAQQNACSNFLKFFTMPVFQGKFISSNYHDEIFMSFDMQLIDVLINSALGNQVALKPAGGLSDAEEIILDVVFQEHLISFYEIFGGVLQNQKFEKVGYQNPPQDMGLNPQSTFVYFVIEVGLNNTLGKIVVGYSGIFIKNLIKKLNQAKKLLPLNLNKLPPSIFNLIEMPIAISLGKTALSMNEIKGLEIGDVVSFNQNINGAIQIYLSKDHAVLGQAGKKDKQLAVRVVGIEREKQVKIIPPTYEEEEMKAYPGEELQEFGKIREDQFKEEEKTEEAAFGEEEFLNEDLEGNLSDEEFKEDIEEGFEEEEEEEGGEEGQVQG